jgi:transcriptional regulator with XRE-family HTH domain
MPIGMNTTIHILRAVRVAFGLTQAEMATLAGVSPRSIARMELGQERGWNTFVAVQTALEGKGVEFLPKSGNAGWGVRMPKDWEGPQPDASEEHL